MKIASLLRVIRDRLDATAETLAEVIRFGRRGMEEWSFTMRWHRPPKAGLHRHHSLNLFENDLADFEIFTGPLPPIPLPQRKDADVIISGTRSPQLELPYTAHYYIADRLDLGIPSRP